MRIQFTCQVTTRAEIVGRNQNFITYINSVRLSVLDLVTPLYLFSLSLGHQCEAQRFTSYQPIKKE
jgi:hypothetical protein